MGENSGQIINGERKCPFGRALAKDQDEMGKRLNTLENRLWAIMFLCVAQLLGLAINLLKSC